MVKDDIEGLGLLCIKCKSCSCQQFSCGTCNQQFKTNNRDYRYIRAHMEDHVNTTEGVVECSSEHGNEIQNNNENNAGDMLTTFQVDCNNYNINVSESSSDPSLKTV